MIQGGTPHASCRDQRHEREHRFDEASLTNELEMAAKVQRELFPKVLPKAAGIDYAGICRPARGVSGDYYDFLALGDGKPGLLLAQRRGGLLDVSDAQR